MSWLPEASLASIEIASERCFVLLTLILQNFYLSGCNATLTVFIENRGTEKLSHKKELLYLPPTKIKIISYKE